MPSRSQSICAQIGDHGGDLAAEQVDAQRVADLEPHAARQGGVEGDERRAAVVGRPPLAGGEPRASRQGRRIGQAAVAAQRPLRLGRDRRLFDRYSVQPGDAAAHHRHLVEARAGHGAHDLGEAGELVGLDIDEEKGGRLGREPVVDLAREIALDERDGDQHREPDAERQHDLRGRRARAVQIGERQPQRRAARPARAASRPATITAPAAERARTRRPRRRRTTERPCDPARSRPRARRARAPATAVAPSASGGTRRRARSTVSRNSAPAAPGRSRPAARAKRRASSAGRTARQRERPGIEAERAARPAARRRRSGAAPPAPTPPSPAPAAMPTSSERHDLRANRRRRPGASRRRGI